MPDWLSQGPRSRSRNDAYPKFAQPRSTEDVILALGFDAKKAWVYHEQKWKEVDLRKLIPQASIKGNTKAAALKGQLYISDGQRGYSIDLCSGSTEGIASMKKGCRLWFESTSMNLFKALGDQPLD